MRGGRLNTTYVHCREQARCEFLRIDPNKNRAGVPAPLDIWQCPHCQAECEGPEYLLSPPRLRFRPIIASVLKQHHGETEAQIGKALDAAYPCVVGQWKMLKTWADEVAKQMGRKARSRKMPPNPKQTTIFDILQEKPHEAIR